MKSGPKVNEMPMLIFKWPTLGVEVSAPLLIGKNQALMDAIGQSLPLDGLASHSVTSGLDLTVWTPVYAPVPVDFRERIDEMPIGRVFSSGTGGKLLIKYGPQTEWVFHPPIAQVVEEDLTALSEVGRRVWESVFFTKELIPLRVELADSGA